MTEDNTGQSGRPPGPPSYGSRPEEPQEEPRARVRSQAFNWVWLVPIGAALLVLWLAYRALYDRGPAITISFKNVDGLQPGQTKIQHRNVTLGTIESLELTSDMSRVIVHAQMTRQATAHLTENTRFAIISPHVGVGGISGLSTLVSGSYIEMYPGKPAPPKREFVGLDEAPVLPPDTKGRSFTLLANDLGSLTRGSGISFRGVAVGEIEDYKLRPGNKGVSITAFVRAPYDELIHPETRFWNAGGVDLTLGTQGLRIRATSWEQLLAGGVAFETPDEALAESASPAGSVFGLYDNRSAAERAPQGPILIYIADFDGNQRGLDAGTAVELQGVEVGEVTEAHLRYDDQRHKLVTRTTFYIDPSRVHIMNMPTGDGQADRQDVVRGWIEKLVGDGMRAQVTSASFLTGLKLVGLEMDPDAQRAHLEREGEYVKIPSSSAGDLTAVLQNLQSVLKNIDKATSGPQLGHALQSLDDTLTRLDKVTHDIEPDIKSLVKSLRDTADSAQNTLNTVQGLMGNTAPTGTDLPRLMRELTEAARSVRGLADYLDRHPEALLRGRKGDDKQ
jgi:paraquat-inducible protein B